MNLFYKTLIMAFLAGAGAAVTLLVLCREISCQTFMNANVYIAAASAYAAGAAISAAFKKALLKFDRARLNLVISLSAIAGIFVSMAGLFFIRYCRVMLGLSPEQDLPLFAALALPVIALTPAAAMSYMGASAARTLIINEKTGQQDYIRLVFALGAIAGGFLYVIFLWRYYTNIDVLYTFGILMLAATYVLFRDKSLEGRYTMLAVITAVIIYLAFNVGGFKEKADRASSRAAYKAYYIVAEKEFPTVKFVMAKKGAELYVFEDGKLTYAMPDEKYAKMAKLAAGKNVIILNGGAAGMVEALDKQAGIKEITAYEEDPYTSFILEKLYRSGPGASAKAVFKAGDFSKDAELKGKGPLADTVFMNTGKSGLKAYSGQKLLAVKSLMKPGARLVISAPENKKEEVRKTVQAVFGNAAEETGFITAGNI